VGATLLAGIARSELTAFTDAHLYLCFTQVARCGSISRAASDMGIEPSTLARHIGRLETEVGVLLFHRSGRGMTLTDAGSALLKNALRLVEALESTRNFAADLANEGPSRIVIAAMPTIAQMCFVSLAEALRTHFPGIRLQLREAFGHEIVRCLQEGQVDVALLYVPSRSQIVDYDFLLQESLHAIMPANYPVLSDPLSVGEFITLPLILPSTAHGLRALAEDWAQQAGSRLNLVMECDGSNSVIRRLVMAGHGCTLLPLATVYDDVRQGLLKSVPLEGRRALRSVALATACNRPPATGLEQVKVVLRATVAGLVDIGRWPGVERMAAQTLPR
jgi:DNA-binding transcriptional LysR family regulator